MCISCHILIIEGLFDNIDDDAYDGDDYNDVK